MSAQIAADPVASFHGTRSHGRRSRLRSPLHVSLRRPAAAVASAAESRSGGGTRPTRMRMNTSRALVAPRCRCSSSPSAEASRRSAISALSAAVDGARPASAREAFIARACCSHPASHAAHIAEESGSLSAESGSPSSSSARPIHRSKSCRRRWAARERSAVASRGLLIRSSPPTARHLESRAAPVSKTAHADKGRSAASVLSASAAS
mmetsp:Transcript_26858/g.90544  ORF Transcript_26858/g.90544 Transcript_26858/m.90544 type:complete len:208 (+) Transcript_26858:338-961(+)